MTLIENWRRLWFRLWSARLNVLGAVLLFSDFVLGLVLDRRSPPWVIVLGGAINVAAFVSRFVWQPKATATAQAETVAVQTASSVAGIPSADTVVTATSTGDSVVAVAIAPVPKEEDHAAP